MEKQKLEVIVMCESLIESVISDCMTFGLLTGTVWFNYTFIGNSKFVNVLILIMLFMYLVQVSKSKKFTNKEDAIKYLRTIK